MSSKLDKCSHNVTKVIDTSIKHPSIHQDYNIKKGSAQGKSTATYVLHNKANTKWVRSMRLMSERIKRKFMKKKMEHVESVTHEVKV